MTVHYRRTALLLSCGEIQLSTNGISAADSTRNRFMPRLQTARDVVTPRLQTLRKRLPEARRSLWCHAMDLPAVYFASNYFICYSAVAFALTIQLFPVAASPSSLIVRFLATRLFRERTRKETIAPQIPPPSNRVKPVRLKSCGHLLLDTHLQTYASIGNQSAPELLIKTQTR